MVDSRFLEDIPRAKSLVQKASKDLIEAMTQEMDDFLESSISPGEAWPIIADIKTPLHAARVRVDWGFDESSRLYGLAILERHEANACEDEKWKEVYRFFIVSHSDQFSSLTPNSSFPTGWSINGVSPKPKEIPYAIFLTCLVKIAKPE